MAKEVFREPRPGDKLEVRASENDAWIEGEVIFVTADSIECRFPNDTPLSLFRNQRLMRWPKGVKP